MSFDASVTDPTGLAESTDEDGEDFETWWRARSMHSHNTLRASTGLLRVREAGSGPEGSFRFALVGGFYSGSGFLCSDTAPCFERVTGVETGEDDVDRIETDVTLSVTPWPFLEAFAGFYNTATSDDQGTPQLLQVLGDMNLGVKVFTPPEPDQILLFGGEAELLLLNGTGGVGLDGGSTGFALRALGTLDLGNRKRESERVPLRVHLNAGYVFDNSAKVVEDIESTPPPTGRGEPIERIERYGLGISRVDSFEIGLGAEYIHEVFRPFAEWTFDIPVNRQGYVCNIDGAASRGDLCLGESGGFSTTPSRLSFGTRIYPWAGLALQAGVDIGTGGTSEFLEETTPESPYHIWLGVAYAVDTVPPKPVIEKVKFEEPVAAEPHRYIVGQVVDRKAGTAIPDALLRYEGRDLTGMIAGEDGTFRSADLEPGTYTLHVYADGYKDAQCMVSIPTVAGAPAEIQNPWESGGVGPTPQGQPQGQQPYGAPAMGAAAGAPPMPGQPGQPGQPGMYGAPGAPPEPTAAPGADIEVNVRCELEELPRVAQITGVLVDAETNGPVAGASVKITDPLNRELELDADARGAFQFGNVPFGTSHVAATAPGYMTSVTKFEIDDRKDLEARISLNKRPETPNVVVTTRELKLKRQVHFTHDSAELLPDSMAIIEEIAEVLKEHPEITRVEIQGHTDNTGPASYNRRLSQQRAETVVENLTSLGVDPTRLEARGYGPDKPLVPNVSEANRARNRRVQLIVLERE